MTSFGDFIGYTKEYLPAAIAACVLRGVHHLLAAAQRARSFNTPDVAFLTKALPMASAGAAISVATFPTGLKKYCDSDMCNG